MTGFLTHNPNIEPENKDIIEPKEQTNSNYQKTENKPIIEKPISYEPKAPRKTNVLKAILIGFILLGLLAGSFVAYDKYQKGELNLNNINLFKSPDKNTSQTRDSNTIFTTQDRNAVNLDLNDDQNVI